MKKKTWLAGLLFALTLVVFTGCAEVASNIEYADAEEAKTALDTASEVKFKGDFEETNQTTNVLADDKVAGYMEESGIIHTKWTVTVDDETWFYIKPVTDEEFFKDEEGIVKGATYGYYDKNDKCLGYAQKRAEKNQKGSAYYIYYFDADGNPKDYFTDEDGTNSYDSEGNVIATGNAEMDGMVGDTFHVQIDKEEGTDVSIDFMDKMVVYVTLCDELKDWYSNR